jgi:hypothetical protein
VRRAELVDTSILVEILNVPGRNAHRKVVLAELDERRSDQSVSLLLPTATVLETGNHIHQVPDGHARRRCAGGFAELLAQTVAGRAPWTLLNASWDGPLLEAIRAGAGTGMDLVEHAVQRCLSCADLSVVAERDAYRRRLSASIEVLIWTMDEALRAWS